LIAIVICVAILALGIVLIAHRGDNTQNTTNPTANQTTPGVNGETKPSQVPETTNGKQENTDPTENQTTPGVNEETQPSQVPETTGGTQDNTKPTENQTTPGVNEETQPSQVPETTGGAQDNTKPTENQTTPGVNEETKPTQAPEATGGTPEDTGGTPEDTGIIRNFPYTIPGTKLVIEQINSYDGIFFEDGSDRTVSDVAAIVLANKSGSGVEYVNITLKCGDTQMRFIGTTLEAGARMIILEADGKKLQKGDYRDCTAEFSSVDKFASSKQVYVEENGRGGLLVTNLTAEDIPCVRIFYKYYMDDVDVYVGGITYTAKLVDLKAGKSIVVTPAHYYTGFSKVVMVKIYETKD
jgi:hypothetical protein